MNLLLITYALRNRERNYDSFYVALRGNAIQWWHYIENTHVVFTAYDTNELATRLAIHIEPTDSLLIVPVTGPINGWLPMEAWEWLTGRIEAVNNLKSLPPGT